MGTWCRIATHFHTYHAKMRVHMCNTNKHKNNSCSLIGLDYSVALMTPLQLQLQLAQKMINMGIPESLIAQALTRVLIDEYGIQEGNFRRVCQNTRVDPIIEINDDAAWYEKYNGFMTETP
jgi:hypothetical protein